MSWTRSRPFELVRFWFDFIRLSVWILKSINIHIHIWWYICFSIVLPRIPWLRKCIYGKSIIVKNQLNKTKMRVSIESNHFNLVTNRQHAVGQISIKYITIPLWNCALSFSFQRQFHRVHCARTTIKKVSIDFQHVKLTQCTPWNIIYLIVALCVYVFYFVNLHLCSS